VRNPFRKASRSAAVCETLREIRIRQGHDGCMWIGLSDGGYDLAPFATLQNPSRTLCGGKVELALVPCILSPAGAIK
jgi:hypothetical protein